MVARAADPPHPPASAVSPRRELPDYDGLPDPGPRAVEVLAWVPRVIFFPVYLVTEFVVRRPLGWLVVTAERNEWPSEILSFFTFGGQKNVGIVPSFYVDLGFRPTAGVYFFWNELLHPRHDIRLRATVWTDGYTFSFADRWRTDGAGSRLQLRGEATRRPDVTFYGLGPRSLDEDLRRFGLDRWAAELAYDWRLGYGEHVRASLALRDHRFRESRCCDAPLEDELRDGYGAFAGRLDVTFDTRSGWPRRQTGVRASAMIEHVSRLGGEGSWLRTGGTAGAFWDVTMGRIVGITATAQLVEPLEGEVPFLELIDLGGGPAMNGFRPRRLLGASAASASLRYEWPIWAALAGSLQVEVGNVFDGRFEDFDPSLLRLSTSIGIRSMGASDHELQFILGVGTETFDQGAALTAIRLGFGGTYGF